MYKFSKLLLVSALFLSIGFGSQAQSQGNLVIVGGGLEDTTSSVFNKLIGFAGGPEKATFAVIPTASSVPVQSFEYFRDELISYGVKPENIHLIKIALVDDDSTTGVNESEWGNNGNDRGMAALVRSCSAVWFTGGDQMRITKALYRPDGSKTPVLEAVWEVYRSGGVIGGTSAGAAIMSEAMICGGNSLAALTHGVIRDYKGDDFPEGDGVLMSTGLGFFPLGMVDQHFEKRCRLARLVIALMDVRPSFEIGFGVDENTALIYIGSQNLVKVAGCSGVTIVNTSGASISYVQGMPVIENLSVSYLEEDDSYDGKTGMIIPAQGKKATRGNEYYNIENPGQAGILSANSTSFRDLVTINLIDNKGTESVSNLSFSGKDSGFLVTLSKTPLSQGYYTDQPGDFDRYTVANVRMDISPVRIAVSPLIK
jgi:cyanophycinase